MAIIQETKMLNHFLPVRLNCLKMSRMALLFPVTAAGIGVTPFLSATLCGAPCFRSQDTALGELERTAWWSGVAPRVSVAFNLAPFLKRAWATSTLSLDAAACSEVWPLVNALFGSIPVANSDVTLGRSPIDEKKNRSPGFWASDAARPSTNVKMSTCRNENEISIGWCQWWAKYLLEWHTYPRKFENLKS